MPNAQIMTYIVASVLSCVHLKIHTHLLEDPTALTGGRYPSFLPAQGDLEGEQEEKHLFLSCYEIRHD